MSVSTLAVRRSMAWHRPLMIFVGLMAVLTAAAALGVLMDDRVLGGAPIWLKPFKFAVSFVIYGATIAWIISRLPDRRRWAWVLGTIIAITAVIEMVIIVGQAARGTHSHFNVSSALNAALWSTMGFAIVVLWLATLVIAAFAARRQFGDWPFTLAIRFGLLVALIGMALGFLMTAPTADQLQAIESGAASLAGAHSVGVADGGPGLPVTAWSTTGGDLRVSHFVGLHGLQALPLLAWLLALPRLGLDERTRTRLVTTGAAGYLGLVGLLLWQALRGQPLIMPDGWTLGATTALFVAVVTSVMTILYRARHTGSARTAARS
ncbi:MAG: hypothetical protein M3228_03085 [Actinomycetota bacterium]|nr:hypothetical protein [Actinomycetota bacterium]